jgi:ureidoacrylate peracid hydrolase
MNTKRDTPGLNQIVTPAHTALLLVDMQHDFCSPGGVMDSVGAEMSAIEAIVPKLTGFVTEARRHGVTVVNIRTEHPEEDISAPQRNLWQRRGVNTHSCDPDSWGASVLPGLTPLPDDLCITKTRYSAFVGTDLDTQLRGRGIKTLIVTGVSTNVCVESTWRHGFMLDYFIVVPEDLVACGSGVKFHDMALENLQRYFGVLTDSKTIAQAWGS